MKIPRIALAAYGFALAIIILDQLTKAWVLDAMSMLTADGALIDKEMWWRQSIPVIDPILPVGVEAALCDDLNTPSALAELSRIAADARKAAIAAAMERARQRREQNPR